GMSRARPAPGRDQSRWQQEATASKSYEPREQTRCSRIWPVPPTCSRRFSEREVRLRASRFGGHPSRGLPAEARCVEAFRVACQPKLAVLRHRAKAGGSAWESNPAPPRERGATDFEDREGHRAPFTSEKIVLRIEECGLRAIADSSESAIRNPQTQVRSAFDQTDVAGAWSFLRVFRGKLDTLAFSQQLEHGVTHGAAVKEVFDSAFVAEEAER